MIQLLSFDLTPSSVDSHWIYKKKKLNEAPKDMHGFVYMITNKEADRKYIGRKYLESARRVKVAGKKRRKIVKTPTNWKIYTGSSKPLNKDIEKLGKGKFKFEILVFGETKGQVNYLEENVHHRLHVVAREEYYNDCIGPRRFANVRLSEEVINKLNKVVK